MRGFKPDDQRQPQGGNMGHDAVMAAIARQNQQQTAPQAEPPKPESSPMQSLRQIFSGTVFDPRSRQDKREREAGLADGGRVRPRGFVAGPGTGTSDSIKARLSDGEYVLPADTVAAVGVDALDALKDATHTPVAKPDKNRAGEPLFANAGLVDDERKRNSFGDAAAAANDYGVQQVMGKATQMTAAPEVRAAIGQQLDAPARVQAAVSQIPTGISGSRPQASTPAAQTTLPVAAPVADPQVQSDRAAIGSAWNSVKGMNENAGRAIADMATLVPRGLVGAYDSVVVRPMRAAGLNAAYLSPALVPDGVDPSSMTPFTDQKRLREANTTAAIAPTQTDQRIASGAQPVPGAPAASPINTTDRSGDAYMPGADANARPMFDTPAAPASNQVMPGVYQHGRGQYSDNPAGMGFAPGAGNPSSNNIAAADALAARSAADVAGTVARGFQPQQAQITAPQVEHSGNSWARRNELRNAQVSASSMTEQPGYGGIVTRRGVVGGQKGGGPASQQYAALLAQDMKARGLEPELAGKAMQENAATQRTGMQETGANQRSADRLASDAQRFALDAQAKGFDIRNAQRREGILQRYDAAKTDDERAALVKQFPDVFGRDKEQGRKMEVVRGSVDPMTGKREGDYAVVFDPATGTARQVSIGSQLPPIDQNPAALAIKNGPGSDAEKRKQLQALGYT